MDIQNNGYKITLNNLKNKIRDARLKAILTANENLLIIYWEIGKTILEQQTKEGWGAKIIDTLALDLKLEFPDFKGLSVRNLKYMRAFAEAYPQFTIVQQGVAQIQSTDLQKDIIVQQRVAQLPWGHHIVILTKSKQIEERIFYIDKCLENHWSRDVLALQINSALHKRVGNSLNNFSNTLTQSNSDLVNETFKNPYLFDFLSMGEKMKERDLEKALITNLKSFILELGKGFAYVGNQYNLVVEDDDYFLDLLFYNTHLHCYVVFELKIGDFKPEFAGKLNFYINTIDSKIKTPFDNATIGILLCKTPNETVVKYSLQNIQAPLGVSEYELVGALPKRLKGEIPSIEELEKEIEDGYEELKNPAQKRFDALKEKLSTIKGGEIKQTATKETLFEIFDKSLLLLYQTLLEKLEALKELFISTNFHWQGKDKPEKIEDLEKEWKNEANLNVNNRFYFTYRFCGFKKAGVEAFDTGFQLDYIIEPYWYGFVLVNHNKGTPLIKKLYGEQLSLVDIETIVETIYNKLMDEIENKVDEINSN